MYEEGEKSSNFFLLNLEKIKEAQGIIKKPKTKNKEITDPNEINNEKYRFS